MIPPSLFQEPPGTPYIYSEQKDNDTQFTETGLESRPQDSSSSFTPYRPTQTEDPSTDLAQQFGQMKIKRKPPPGMVPSEPLPQAAFSHPSEYSAYQGGTSPLPPKQNAPSFPPRPSLPTQSTYPRTNPTSQYQTTGSYQPPPWTSDQGPYPTTIPSQNQPQYQSPSPEQQPNQRTSAPYNPQGYDERPGYSSTGSGSNLIPNSLQGGYKAYEGDGRADVHAETTPGMEPRYRPGSKEPRSSFFGIGFGKRGT